MPNDVELLHDGQASRHRRAAGKSVSIGGPIQPLLRFAFSASTARLHQKIVLGCKGVAAHDGLVLPSPHGSGRADRPFEKIGAAEAWALLFDPALRRALAAAELLLRRTTTRGRVRCRTRRARSTAARRGRRCCCRSAAPRHASRR